MKKCKKDFKRITLFLNEIDWMFELNNFERHLVEVSEQPEGQDELAAEVVPDMIYRELTIRIYPYFWSLSLETQRKALLHELVHTLTQGTKMIAMDMLHGTFHSIQHVKNENEKTTSKITRLLDRLLKDNGLRYAKRGYKNYLKK